MHRWRHRSVISHVLICWPGAHSNLEGPITVLNQTIFRVIEGRTDSPDYLHFIGWVYLWGAIFHWVTAALNCESHRVGIHYYLHLISSLGTI